MQKGQFSTHGESSKQACITGHFPLNFSHLVSSYRAPVENKDSHHPRVTTDALSFVYSCSIRGRHAIENRRSGRLAPATLPPFAVDCKSGLGTDPRPSCLRGGAGKMPAVQVPVPWPTTNRTRIHEWLRVRGWGISKGGSRWRLALPDGRMPRATIFFAARHFADDCRGGPLSPPISFRGRAGKMPAVQVPVPWPTTNGTRIHE